MRPAWTSFLVASLIALALCASGAPVLGASSALASAADGGRLQLAWRAPAGCPDAAAIEKRVEARLPALDPTSQPLAAEGSIVRERGGYRMELATLHGRRSLGSSNCDELGDAAALMLALMIDPQSSARTTQSAAPRDVWLLIRLELIADVGTLPHVALGPGISVGVRLHETSLELSGSYLPSQALHSPQQTQVAQLHALAGALGACQSLAHFPELSPCLRFDYGRMVGRGKNLTNARGVDAAWALASAAA
ncbi:MAG TPA: hypothetical protein VHZ95_08340, partial [Polyangiales bacterium]|nr:hypothetical protein [Polyangiales bacterium]